MQASDSSDDFVLSDTSQAVLSVRDLVFAEWENDVRQFVPGAKDILHPILINTLPVFYENIAEALSPEHPRKKATSNNDIAAAHGNERARMTSYGPEQIVHEYQLFREAFSRVMAEQSIELTRKEWTIMNSSIDSAVRESIREFTAMHENFRHKLAASLSHDMRNPLSVLVSAAQVLSLAPTSENTPVLITRILENGKRLGAMIENLLDALSFHRGQRVPLTLSEFDVFSLLKKISADANTNQGINSVVEGQAISGHWCCDSLRRAIENLISNAAKYGDGGIIQIRVDAVLERLILSVNNTGSFIPKEHQARIFQYLWRDRENTSIKGWGIGLPFVQNVAESHGGSIAVDSSAELGTTFIIDIPIDCRPFVESQPPK